MPTSPPASKGGVAWDRAPRTDRFSDKNSIYATGCGPLKSRRDSEEELEAAMVMTLGETSLPSTPTKSRWPSRNRRTSGESVMSDAMTDVSPRSVIGCRHLGDSRRALKCDLANAQNAQDAKYEARHLLTERHERRVSFEVPASEENVLGRRVSSEARRTLCVTSAAELPLFGETPTQEQAFLNSLPAARSHQPQPTIEPAPSANVLHAPTPRQVSFVPKSPRAAASQSPNPALDDHLNHLQDAVADHVARTARLVAEWEREVERMRSAPTPAPPPPMPSPTPFRESLHPDEASAKPLSAAQLHLRASAIAAAEIGCDDVAAAVCGLEQLGPKQLRCIEELFGLYATGDNFSAAVWQTFSLDLLRGCASGRLMLPAAHLNALYDDFALHLSCAKEISRLGDRRPNSARDVGPLGTRQLGKLAEGPRPSVGTLGEFLALLAQVAGRWQRVECEQRGVAAFRAPVERDAGSAASCSMEDAIAAERATMASAAEIVAAAVDAAAEEPDTESTTEAEAQAQAEAGPTSEPAAGEVRPSCMGNYHERACKARSLDDLAAIVAERGAMLKGFARGLQRGGEHPDAAFRQHPPLILLLDSLARYYLTVSPTTAVAPTLGSAHAHTALFRSLFARQLERRGARLENFDHSLLALVIAPEEISPAPEPTPPESPSRHLLQANPLLRFWRTSTYGALYAPAEKRIGGKAQLATTATQGIPCAWTPALYHMHRPTTSPRCPAEHTHI